jgi:ABC-type antimicrobial peptide transport system permease subunit
MDFSLWFKTGLEHIADLNAYDHILFLMVLCGTNQFSEIRKVLILVTAFTIGHSLTLALSVFKLMLLSPALVEFLIPVTILLTCIFQFINRNAAGSLTVYASYMSALFFGFIHGLGFSGLLRSMLGKSEEITGPLFAFNLGLEAGQIVIVICVMIFSVVLTRIMNIKRETWNFFLTSAVFGVAFVMAAERLGELI